MFGDDPFFGGGGDGGRDRRGSRRNQRGGGLGGGMLSVFDDDPFFSGGFGNMGGMMQRMDQMMQGMGEGGGFGGDGSGNGTFFSSSSVMTMSTGPDGKKQQYTSHSRSSNVGGERISETKQAYSNNAGLDKVGWERTIGDKGTKVVKERQRGTREETTTRMYHGMDPANGAEFEKAWNEHGGRQALQNFGGQMERQMQRLSSGMNDHGRGHQSRRTPSLRDRRQEHRGQRLPLDEAFPPRGHVLDNDNYHQPSSRQASRHSSSASLGRMNDIDHSQQSGSRQSSRQSSAHNRRIGY